MLFPPTHAGYFIDSDEGHQVILARIAQTILAYIATQCHWQWFIAQMLEKLLQEFRFASPFVWETSLVGQTTNSMVQVCRRVYLTGTPTVTR